MALSKLTADFVTSTLDGALAAGATTATIDSGLDLPATNGVLHIDYDSTTAVGSDNGPETITYATYTSGTGALAGITRGVAGTTDVAHANGATVSAGISVEHLNEYDRKNASDQTIIGKNDVRATRYVALDDPAVVVADATDPANTNWNDVDVSASTSANCYAVSLRGQCTSSSTAGRRLCVRKNGSSVSNGSINVLSRNPATAVSGWGECVVAVDANKIFEWSVSDADVNSIGIWVVGYWEYVD